MHKRHVAHLGARVRQNVAAELKLMDEELRIMLNAQICELEQPVAGIEALQNALSV
jgi:hypothetical protein